MDSCWRHAGCDPERSYDQETELHQNLDSEHILSDEKDSKSALKSNSEIETENSY